MKEQQTLEDLTTPVLENLQVDLFEPPYVPAETHGKQLHKLYSNTRK